MSEATIKIIEMIFALLIFSCAVLYVVHHIWLFFEKRNKKNDTEDQNAYINSVYDEDLAARFTDDYKFPISVTNDKELFMYQLMLFDDGYKTWQKWFEIYDEIKKNYEGDPKKFLQRYYDDRDKIITTTEQSYAYLQFIEDKEFSKKFAIPQNEIPKARWKELYNGEADGKMFMSIDLNKANFQALRYYDKNIVLSAETYEDFINKFSDMQYLRDSKYSRQVIFGKMNAPRQITIEKYLLHLVWENYKKIPLMNKCYMDDALAVLKNDEFVVEVDDNFTAQTGEDVVKDIYAETHVDVKYEIFNLKALKLVSDKHHHSRAMFFIKEIIAPVKKVKLVAVPNQYFPIVWKLFHGKPVNIMDRHFVYEKIDCIFNESFHLEDLSGNVWKPEGTEKKQKKFGSIWPFN